MVYADSHSDGFEASTWRLNYRIITNWGLGFREVGKRFRLTGSRFEGVLGEHLKQRKMSDGPKGRSGS